MEATRPQWTSEVWTPKIIEQVELEAKTWSTLNSFHPEATSQGPELCFQSFYLQILGCCVFVYTQQASIKRLCFVCSTIGSLTEERRFTLFRFCSVSVLFVFHFCFIFASFRSFFAVNLPFSFPFVLLWFESVHHTIRLYFSISTRTLSVLVSIITVYYLASKHVRLKTSSKKNVRTRPCQFCNFP